MHNISSALCRWSAVALPFAVLGCADLGGYNASLARLDYTANDTAASIQVSDPQLYKREDLINERQDEIAYLKNLLSNSGNVVFGSELVRDIETVSSLSGQLGLSFDAGAKQQFKQTEQLSDLEQQIAVTKLQMQLAQVQRDLQLLQAGLANQSAPASTPGSTTTSTTLTSVKPPGLADAKDIATRLESLVQTLVGRLDKASTAPRGGSAASSSPLDQFQDRQAYRRVIQGAINAAALDNLHDFDGNSLFRMQFRATVLPSGMDNNKALGVLRMQIKRPQLGNDEATQLYREWLDHVTHRLNQAADDETLQPDPTLLQLGAEGKLFTTVIFAVPKNADADGKSDCPLVPLKETPSDKCHAVRIAIPPTNSAKDVAQTFRIADKYPEETLKDIKSAREKLDTAIDKLPKPTVPKKGEPPPPAPAECENLTKSGEDGPFYFGRTLTKAFIKHRSQLTALQRGLVAAIGQLNLLSGNVATSTSKVASDIASIDANIARISPEADRFLASYRRLGERCGKPGIAEISVEDGWIIPSEFLDALFESQTDPKTRQVSYTSVKGRASTYAVTPVELVQRVSTAARAADAVQIAASLGAAFPAQGLGGNAGLGYMRAANAKADALERVPLVIGYSEPGDERNVSEPAGFGWLLGPKVVLDPKKKALALEHNLAPYDLTADVSMPGWWPYFEIEYNSSWAPGWQSKRLPDMSASKAAPRTMRVPMRHNRADLDGITTLIVKRLGGPKVEVASIGRIDPRTISACAGTVTFLVQGSNLWRTQAAYLLGMPAKGIEVLPDMTGIRATFDIAGLPQRPSSYEPAQLLLATPNGLASRVVKIDGSRLAANNCGGESVALSPKDDGSPGISSVLPGAVYACDANLRFVVRGKNLNGTDVYLGTIPAASANATPDGKELEVKFGAKIDTRGGSQTTLPLIVRTGKGTASKDVTIERDDCANAGNATRQISVVPVPTGSLDLCAKQATLLVVGANARNVDSARIVSSKPNFTLVAQAVKAVQRNNAMEITFVGFPTSGMTGPDAIGTQVQAILSAGKSDVATLNIPAVCSSYSK